MAVMLFKQFLLCKDMQLCGGDFHKELVAAVAVPAGAGSIDYIFCLHIWNNAGIEYAEYRHGIWLI